MNFSQSTVFSIVASFGLLFINLLISVIEARVLGPEEIGRFQVYITTQTYIATICALGIGQSCIYFINALKIDERKVLSTCVNSTLVLAAVAGIALFVIVISNQHYFGKDSIIGLCIFSFGTAALLLNNIFTPVLLAKMEVSRNQAVKYSSRVVTLVVLVYVLLRGYQLSVGFLLGLTGFTCFLTSLLLYSFFRHRFSFRDGIDFSLLGRITVWGLKLSGNNIASITLSSLPVYFLTWFSVSNGAMNVGYYSRANSLLVVGTVIASSIGPLLYSKWSCTSSDELQDQVRRISMLFIIINVIISAGLIIAAPLLIRLLFGKEFLSAIPVLQLLAFSLVGNGAKEVCYGVLSSQGHPLRILNNLLVGIAICAIGDYLIIPRFGVTGCAAVTSFSSVITCLLLMINVTRITKIRFQDFFVMPTKHDIELLINSLFHKR